MSTPHAQAPAEGPEPGEFQDDPAHDDVREPGGGRPADQDVPDDPGTGGPGEEEETDGDS